ncbi:MAG: tRNA-specific adenosine deaminase [Candidatus Zixiibacteriota bacterium]|nr:MAG: tRNA-specific adenosine deaminase [candidate division Zixibacteria bacterium]
MSLYSGMTDNELQFFMTEALKEAGKAFQADEVPVGAVVVFENKIIGRGYNQTEQLHDATAHAEMIALTAAYNYIGDWRLENCFLFSTLEPCAMCSGAAMLSRIDTIVYGAKDKKFGACGSIFNIPQEPKTNHQIEIISGIMEQEVADLMKLFFKKIRQKKEQIN